MLSRVVTDLVTGAGLKFDERGVHELKGLPGRWDLFTASAWRLVLAGFSRAAPRPTCGTKRTWRHSSPKSVMRCKADIGRAARGPRGALKSGRRKSLLVHRAAARATVAAPAIATRTGRLRARSNIFR
jgi:hypothetical protein